MISREEEPNTPIESKDKGHNALNALAMAAAAVSREPASSATAASASDFNKKRVRRGESFCRMGVDRSISNSLKSPSTQKLKTKRKHVTFSEQTPLFWECSNFEPNCSEEEYEERKNELWYSRHDFEEFLKERIATIRLLQMVHGDADAMRERCPDLCMRGLEPFEANTLNQELQSKRQMHQRIVIAEQTLQMRTGRRDPERICQLAEQKSSWARQRARQLARMDEVEVKFNESSLGGYRRRRSSLATGFQNLMIQQPPEPSPTSSSANSPSSLSFSSSSILGFSSRRRIPVDTAILKEWNAKFLADIRKRGEGDAAISGLPSTTSFGDATAQSRLKLQQLSAGTGASIAPAKFGYYTGVLSSDKNEIASNAPSTDFRFPLRRDSLVALRRDSLLHSISAPSDNHDRSNTEALSSPLNENCFRFPVRRDSLRNIMT